jgi:hypothetical protein
VELLHFSKVFLGHNDPFEGVVRVRRVKAGEIIIIPSGYIHLQVTEARTVAFGYKFVTKESLTSVVEQYKLEREGRVHRDLCLANFDELMVSYHVKMYSDIDQRDWLPKVLRKFLFNRINYRVEIGVRDALLEKVNPDITWEMVEEHFEVHRLP